MTAPRIFVAFPARATPSGGGNQFIRALSLELERRGLRAGTAATADVVLFASYNALDAAVRARRANPSAIFVHRVDGPMRLYLRPDDPRDAIALEANSLLADATVFQTEWCRKANREMGWPCSLPETVIGNAADPGIFRPRPDVDLALPLKVVAASWSANVNKGFPDYLWLDRNLDPSLARLTFVGNSPIAFDRVAVTGPLASADLAAVLANHDIYLTASQKDPCSNSLIEALTVGLPAVARNDGGHPELVGAGGLLFDRPEQIPGSLRCIAQDYRRFRSAIRVSSLPSVVDAYVSFAADLLRARQRGQLTVKSLSFADALLARWRFRGT